MDFHRIDPGSVVSDAEEEVDVRMNLHRGPDDNNDDEVSNAIEQ